MLLLMTLLACTDEAAMDSGTGAGDPAAQATCGPEGGYRHWIVDSLYFARIEAEVSEGFDLDGDVSTTGGSGGCGLQDVTSPEGTPGVDNAFGRLLPFLETTEFIAAEGLIESSIRNGELVLIPELAGVDDPLDDDCVRMAIRRGEEAPMTGTDSSLLAGQTTSLDVNFDDQVFEEVAIVDGSAEGRPLQVTLPLQILNASLEFTLMSGAIRYDLLEDGGLHGVFAGGLSTDYLMQLLKTKNVDPAVAEAVAGILPAVADLDLDGDGECGELSVTFEFTGVPAYVFEDQLE